MTQRQRQIFSINDLLCDHVKLFLNAVEIKKSMQLKSCLETEITIRDISHSIDPNSIKIISDSKISDVTIQKASIDESILKELEDKLFTETTRLDNLSKKMKLLNNFALCVADQSDLDKFNAFIDSFYEKESFLMNEKKNCEDTIKVLEENLKEKKFSCSFEVNFLVDTGQSDSSVKLEIIYQNYATYWTPRYDFNFDSKSKSLSIDIYGCVEQKTGEDLTKTDTSFWLSNINSICEQKMVKFKTLHSKSVQQMLEDMKSHINLKTKNSFTNQKQSGINFTSVLIPEQKLTIKTGSNKFLISKINLNPEFKCEAMASLKSDFQLRAKIKNTAGLVFLEGDASVYLNNDFMRNIRIKNWCLLEEIEIFIGNDSLARISYCPLSITKTKVADKKFIYVFEQPFLVENSSDYAKEMFVLDFFPISSDEKISVKLLEPNRQNSKIKLVKQGCLEFCFNLESGQKVESCTKYSIEYPPEKPIELF